MYHYDRKGPKRGVILYSYCAEYGMTKTLEDCLADVYDMGAHGIEILANSHIDNYPYPTQEWVDNWFRMLDQYELVPVEYSNWIDSHVMGGRELTTEESCAMLERDMRLAHRLGFHIMRCKMPVITDDLAPVKNWREIIKGCLPLAEKLDMKLCPEIHMPSTLRDPMITEYVDFIKETGTKNFGLCIDFSIFRTDKPNYKYNVPEDLIPLLPYIYCCHAKFFTITDDFEEPTVPYKELIQVFKDHNWDGYLVSEYEGPDKFDQGYEVGQTLRKHHIMMKKYIGD